MQREQSFWASRRDTYAKMMTSLQSLDRAGWECRDAFKSGDFSDAHLKKIQDAGHAFEQVRFVMSLEAPHDPFIATALKTAAGRVLRLVTGVIAWHQDNASSTPMATADEWFDDIRRELKKLGAARDSLFQTMRNDLHREVGGDPEHFGVRVRVRRRRTRQRRIDRLLIDNDLVPVSSEGQGDG
ncbi:hypothetical protein [Streptomyces sp. NPDC026092]|uniref:hypothetical protein n=1 Tax=Streptomyces sp. NPDC026092 TaxID=3154797 RepID=UPI0033DB918B